MASKSKNECESVIRHLCGVWADEMGIASGSDVHPSFVQFADWVRSKGYGSYLEFRSAEGALNTAEYWFDQEFRQTWRR